MIWEGDRYITLMASLPTIGFLSDKEPPINSARLRERLRTLAPEDADLIDRLTNIISWRSIDLEDDDAAFVKRAEAVVASIQHPTLAAVIHERLEMRTLIAALRRRHAGEDAPARADRWGYGEFVERIRTHWAQPDFGLGGLFSWLPAAKEKLDSGDAIGLERLQLETAWKALERHTDDHEFDLVAVAFYLLRWSMADRWARYDAEAAQQRFGELLDAALADVPPVAMAA